MQLWYRAYVCEYIRIYFCTALIRVHIALYAKTDMNFHTCVRMSVHTYIPKYTVLF